MTISDKNVFFRNKITAVNFILAIGVMFIHSENIALYENSRFSIALFLEYFISHSLGDLAVPTFFMMSSYLFYRNYQPNQLINKYHRRIKSTLCPYLIWNCLYLVAFYAITSLPFISSFMTTERFTLSPHLIFEAIFYHKYNKVFWFMQQLIYFIILSPLVYLLLKKKWGIAWIGAFLIIGLFYPTLPDNQYGIRINMMVYWLIGCWFAIHKPSKYEEKGSKSFVFASIFIACVLVIVRFILDYAIDSSTLLSFISPILMFFNVPFLWFALSSFVPSHTPWWMRISFFIYSAHPLLVDAWKKGSARLLPDNSFFCLANYVLAVFFSFIVITIAARFLLKYMPRTWTILNGGRQP